MTDTSLQSSARRWRSREFSGFVTAMAAVWLVAGCRNATSPEVANPRPVVASQESPPSRAELRADLEATVLENYLQLSLGNMEAYADGVLPNRTITLIGIRPDDLVFGYQKDCYATSGDTSICMRKQDRLPLRGRSCGDVANADIAGYRSDDSCVKVLSKNLEIHLSKDSTVGWIFDEISLRIPYQGREVAIPIRLTALFERRFDRWMMVMEHMSYPVPHQAILTWAREGVLPESAVFQPQLGKGGHAQDLIRMVRSTLVANGPSAPDSEHSQPLFISRALDDRTPDVIRRAADNVATSTAGDIVRQATSEASHNHSFAASQGSISDALILWPDPYREFYGTLTEPVDWAMDFGEGTEVKLTNMRIQSATAAQVSWLAGNVMVTPPGIAPITMRMTAIFESRDQGVWQLKQLHISVAVTEALIAQRVLGRSGWLDNADSVRPPGDD